MPLETNEHTYAERRRASPSEHERSLPVGQPMKHKFLNHLKRTKKVEK